MSVVVVVPAPVSVVGGVCGVRYRGRRGRQGTRRGVDHRGKAANTVLGAGRHGNQLSVNLLASMVVAVQHVGSRVCNQGNTRVNINR